MSRIFALSMLTAMLALGAGVAWAQFGTANLPSATPWQGDEMLVRAEGRFFQEENQTWGIFIRGASGDNADGIVGYFDWETRGEDPIAGAVRQSDYEAVVLDFRWLLSNGGPRIALRLGADLQISNSSGTNLAIMQSALGSGPIPAVSLPLEWGIGDNALLILEPKVVWFDDRLPTTFGGTIEGFGDLVIIGGGVRYRVDEQTDFVGDVACPVSAHNTIDDATNAVDEDVVWSAGISHELGGEANWTIDIFATNAAGPTPATSAIATPDQSVGVGVGVGGSW